MIKEVCNHNRCTGCTACYSICPKNAITMQEDQCGFVYPVISEKCVECGMCINICPVNNELAKQTPIKCIAARNKMLQEEGLVTSGGIATTLYKYFLLKNKKNVVYGTVYSPELGVFLFRRCNDITQVNDFSGSKYVQIVPKDIFSKIKADLLSEHNVLFVGTPCQVQGLKSFLNKDYINLVLVDIVCHGVPSQKMLFETIGGNKNVRYISFREKNKYVLIIEKYGGSITKISSRDSVFYEGFSNGNNLRESCHSCKFAGIDRVSDITIGDFWGLGENSIFKKDQESGKGISLVLINTSKGDYIFNEIRTSLDFEYRDVEEARKGNSQLQKCVPATKHTKKFLEMYKNHNYISSIKAARNIKERIKNLPVLKQVIRLVRK